MTIRWYKAEKHITCQRNQSYPLCLSLPCLAFDVFQLFTMPFRICTGYINFEEFLPKLDELCHFVKKGRPHYCLGNMFRILILQTLQNMSTDVMLLPLCNRFGSSAKTGRSRVNLQRKKTAFRLGVGTPFGCGKESGFLTPSALGFAAGHQGSGRGP